MATSEITTEIQSLLVELRNIFDRRLPDTNARVRAVCDIGEIFEKIEAFASEGTVDIKKPKLDILDSVMQKEAREVADAIVGQYHKPFADWAIGEIVRSNPDLANKEIFDLITPMLNSSDYRIKNSAMGFIDEMVKSNIDLANKETRDLIKSMLNVSDKDVQVKAIRAVRKVVESNPDFANKEIFDLITPMLNSSDDRIKIIAIDVIDEMVKSNIDLANQETRDLIKSVRHSWMPKCLAAKKIFEKISEQKLHQATEPTSAEMPIKEIPGHLPVQDTASEQEGLIGAAKEFADQL